MSQQSIHTGERYLPNAEETQYVVYAESIKIVGHLFQTLMPPFIPIFRHSFPIVGGKAPVLSCDAEGIGGSTCLSVHMKQLRGHPCLHTAATDAYGDVALEPYAQVVCMSCGLLQLFVQDVLHKCVVTSLF